MHVPSRLLLLRVILAACIISTAIHYVHNYVEVDQYPQFNLISNEVLRISILIFWPLLTAIGLVGYRLYTRQCYRPAHICLATYSTTGISTLGHFLEGSPNIPPFFYATIFTDGLTGLAVLIFTLWSVFVVAPRFRLSS